MKETERKEYGMTDKGAVVLIIKRGQSDEPGGDQPVSFQVRHGVRTVGEYGSLAAAELAAKGLVGQFDEPAAPAEAEKPAARRR